MRLVSFNVNGIRACLGKGLLDYIYKEDADFFCIQETKANKEQVELDVPGYYQYWNSAEKKGYSGTLVLSKKEALRVVQANLDNEGRIVALEYEHFYLINNYVPNSQDELARLPYRLDWESKRREFMSSLDTNKPVIMCGDLNVAHNEIDLKNPDTNHHNAGFSDEERDAFTKLLNAGFIDTYRYLHPDRIEYSWWSYRMKARERNVGWRIDYFIVSDRLKEKINEASIRTEVLGSDHCPVFLDISIDL